MRFLMWFREDLRTTDNKALTFAAQNATKGCGAIFLITKSFWQKHDMAPVRMRFLMQGLQVLCDELAKKNIALKVVTVNRVHDIAKTLFDYAQEIEVDSLVFNKQYEVDELQRDQTVTEYFVKKGLETKSFDDQIVFGNNEIRSQTGDPFKVFTPYKKSWLRFANQFGLPELSPTLKKQAEMLDKPSKIPQDFTSSVPEKLWPAGEKAAQKRLKNFIDDGIKYYDTARDFPAQDGTSKLSAYLSAGMISPRQCFHAAMELKSTNKGIETWINELIWREFYKHILIAFPQISKNKPFKPETDQIQWNYDEKILDAWQKGQTGYPFVDAGMRQLNETGWMHNRLRMVVAMFLTKTCFIDWRLGEKYFIENLIDGDLAANNGGWQWCASTGVDAAPYFRIFNPLRQSERFDPEGKFIKQYCPELAKLDAKSIHEPYKHFDLFSERLNYPQPIVNHDSARERVMKAFKKVHK